MAGMAESPGEWVKTEGEHAAKAITEAAKQVVTNMVTTI